MATALVAAACGDGGSHQERQKPRRRQTEAQDRETERLRPIIEALTGFQNRCESTEPVETVPVRGKVLVWSIHEGRRLDNAVPSELAPAGVNDSMTLFLSKSQRQDRGWFFTNANDGLQTLLRLRAYRIDIELCGVYWPEKTLAGRVVLEGEEPPVRGGQPVAEHGKAPDIKAWISRQPRKDP